MDRNRERQTQEEISFFYSCRWISGIQIKAELDYMRGASEKTDRQRTETCCFDDAENNTLHQVSFFIKKKNKVHMK